MLLYILDLIPLWHYGYGWVGGCRFVTGIGFSISANYEYPIRIASVIDEEARVDINQ